MIGLSLSQWMGWIYTERIEIDMDREGSSSLLEKKAKCDGCCCVAAAGARLKKIWCQILCCFSLNPEVGLPTYAETRTYDAGHFEARVAPPFLRSSSTRLY